MPRNHLYKQMIRQTAAGIWIIDGDQWISRWVEEKGQLQHDYQTLPLILLEINEGDVVVDAGAAIGDTAWPFLERVGPTGRVYAFEPNPDAFECLWRNLTPYRANTYCYKYALSDQDGEVIGLNVDANAGAAYASTDGPIRLKAVTLDALVQPLSSTELLLQRLDFLKIDCEGFEAKILRGAEQTILKFKPKMAIELNEGALRRQGASIIDVLQWLHDHGYQCWPLNCPDRSQPLPQFDILATP